MLRNTEQQMSKNQNTDDLDAPVWGAEAFAKIVRLEPGQVYYLLERGRLDATKVSHKKWVSSRRRLYQSLGLLGSAS